MSYGADLFVPNRAMTQKLDVFWHRVQRWVTNCFSSTPVSILAVESSLPQVELLLAHKRRLAAVTLVCTPSPICTAAARLPSNFSSPYPFRTHDSLRPAKWRKPLTGPLPWNSVTETRIRTRLPLDDLAHLALRFAPTTGPFPARLQHLVPTDFDHPDPPLVTWQSLRARVTLSLKED